jgi:hypothetical protein
MYVYFAVLSGLCSSVSVFTACAACKFEEKIVKCLGVYVSNKLAGRVTMKLEGGVVL